MFLFSVNLRDCGYKKEADCEESWATGHQEVSVEIPQEADNLTASHSPDAQVGHPVLLEIIIILSRLVFCFPRRFMHIGARVIIDQ